MSRLFLLAVLIYLLLLLGLATASPSLLALAIPLVVYLGAALLCSPSELRLKAVRTVNPDRVQEGTPAIVTLRITNEGPLLEQVLIQDLIPAPLAPTNGKHAVAARIAPQETVELEYAVRAQRGRFELSPVRVTASDALGLVGRDAVLVAPAALTVQPYVRRLRQVAIRPLRTRGTAGPVPARQGGSGVAFYSVREYQPGDPRHWINWRVSARHDSTLFTNEFEQERIADVGLILDARGRSNIRTSSGSLFEHAVRATASLADAFLRDGNRTALLVYGQYLDWTLPGYGKVQRERILQALSRVQPGDKGAFEKLEYLPTRLFPAESQIVLVSPLSREDLPVAIGLRARGYQVMVIRPDAVTFELEGLRRQPHIDLAARILRVESALVNQSLRQAGIQVVEWPVDRPFDQVLHASLGRTPHWFRAVGVGR